MIKYDGMKAEESGNGGNKQLPVGAYVAKVLGARVIGLAPDQRLEVMVDVAEGPYTDFYMKKFAAAKEKGSNYEIRYKGIVSLRIPNPDNKNALYPESDRRKFNDMISRFQNSNEGISLYNEDGFDETKLTDLAVGISVQEAEMNGYRYTKPVRFENVDDVRQGLIKPMEPKRSNPTNAPMVDQRSGMNVVTEKLPWDDKPY